MPPSSIGSLPQAPSLPRAPSTGPRPALQRAAAARAAAAAIGHAVAGAYHKAKEGTHCVGAKVQALAPRFTQAQQMAQALHSAKAAVAFADARVQAKHAVHYATLSMRGRRARAAGAQAAP